MTAKKSKWRSFWSGEMFPPDPEPTTEPDELTEDKPTSNPYTYWICGRCLTMPQDGGLCDSCGADTLFHSVNGWITGLPGEFGCPGCGGEDEVLVLRGWVRVFSFVFWTSESRSSGYVCPNCALKRSASSLLITACLGWLSIFSILFYAWRATYYNWLSIGGSPTYPQYWGATSEAELLASLRAFQEEEEPGYIDGSFDDTPLAVLSRDEIELVLGADGLYELLGVTRGSSEAGIKSAYREKAKQAHPDLQSETDHSGVEHMIRINRAWEILGEDRLRRAYDWTLDRAERS